MFRQPLTDDVLSFSPAAVGRGVPLIVDSFAGGGGASTGIEMALGRSPDIAINHNSDALALHAVNHPETLHLSENIFKVDPLDYVAGRHVGLAWFSPDCKHFSKAKGGKPVERNIRDLAWIIVLWAERAKPDVIIMENVEEWKDWGPLIETDRGLMPCPDNRGKTFQKWCKSMRRAGYKLQHRELRACDYGAPTIRKRLFVVARRDGKPIIWPAPTHGAPSDADVISGRKKPWRTAAEIIDWSKPCPSIFDSSSTIMAKFGLRAIRPLAENTMARVARGMKRYVLDAKRPFLVQTGYGERAGQEPRCLDPDAPLGTVVASGIKHAVACPHIASYYSHTGKRSERVSDTEDPIATITTENRHAVIAPSVIRFNSGATGQDAREPLSTITANGFIKRPGGAAPLGVIAPHLLSMKGADRRDSAANAPHPTVLAGGGHSAVVAPILSYAQQGGGNRSVEEPHHTITASNKDQNTLAVAFVAQNNYLEPGHDAREPVSTIVGKGSTQSPVVAFISRQFGESVGSDINGPLGTTTAGGGGKSALVAPHLHAYYGADQDTPEDEPFHTITTKPRFSHVEAAISAPPFTEEQHGRARQVADFLRSYGFWDEHEFVTLTINGDEFVIVDIGMRMLTPRELYSAQGFPVDYKIDRDIDGKPFTKSVQVSCVGNSVSPPVAEALVAANCNHLVRYQEAAE